ncbi:hypothetical protein C2S53_001663 [Perilla frutescens var. hirtella]|uniref:Uncharacterized protein n=1 Tax=Perilla frutescens var. hirtella TaxID=608512 RepID=A0AAD4P4T1_PERFH|nr:hypothetical protein C2S53_001663 [Perilla frutescens var. hirtella]
MEVDQIQCKFPNISNGGYASTIVSHRERMDDDEEEGERGRSNSSNGRSGGAADPRGGAVGGLYGWPSSRIVRVSKATGGKDRHSKVLTSRGLRDRRVRLSVNTAIQFYDLQDRLGYDQPSKAVEWLLAAAASSIAELPPMNSPFPDTNHKLLIEEKKMCVASGADHRTIRLDSVMDGGGGGNRGGIQQEAAAGGSSSSENSKGSGLSISRSESRFRARERAKERALEKEKENDESSYVASFTELLSGGGINSINGGGGGGGGGVGSNKDVSVCRDQSPINNENSDHQSNFFQKFPMDYFSSGLSGPPAPLQFTAAANHHPELQPFSFASDHLVSANSSAINRGTLQSNSSSSLQFPPSFFTSAAAPAANHRQFFPGFDARLQLYYGDAHGSDGRHPGPKRKDKP